MEILPVDISLTDSGRLRIAWNDDQIREYDVAQLRKQCPCATCRQKRNAPPPAPLELPVISRAEAQPLKIAKMEPVGRYAYAIHFSDGHDTGIYTFESLRELGEAVRLDEES